jgi:hypothetical protein
VRDIEVDPSFTEAFPNVNEFFRLARFHAGPLYPGSKIPVRPGAPTFFGPDLTVAQYGDRASSPRLYVVSRRDLHTNAEEPFSKGAIIAVHHDVPIRASLDLKMAPSLIRGELYSLLIASLDIEIDHRDDALGL